MGLESLCRSLSLSLSFFCSLECKHWSPFGRRLAAAAMLYCIVSDTQCVREQQTPAPKASRFLLGRGGRAKVVVIESWLWWVLRVFVVLSLSLSFVLLSANIGHRLAAAWRRRQCCIALSVIPSAFGNN